ncbi:hypothetical protein EJ03DRAFT_331745 [Teratosphaeria nubilosa]|uniref:Secreted protein n=1 Tax=Teratosphaeria nubilosa TaxID=161662 RepID=A0A6G1KVD1_9PEZI|nr:hypothetical protein EJ03DRAFT_331745 [Teratosphaeria nubilosa]
MKLATTISLILPTIALLAYADVYGHLRCQTVNKNTGKRDFSVGGDWTKHIVYDKDKLALQGPVWIYQHHGLDCAYLVTQFDIDTFNQYCIQRCIPGKPQFVCKAVSSGCCFLKQQC